MMPVERPTFSESWYRVANLYPRLRATVQIYRQHYRGHRWYVVQDPSSNQYFRLNEPGYRFVGLLDGRRTIAEVWKTCNEQFGDGAPTQGEVIQLLGQLYAGNLIHAELPPDAEGLLKRYKTRVSREVRGYVSNFLFIRIPLLDPDEILNELLPAVRWVFSWIGVILLAVLVSVGGYFLLGRIGDLTDQAGNVLDPSNLPLLFLSFWFSKILHEFGHGFACKKFGKDAGTSGEVHTMGIMFLVFTPLPYVDASSAWAYRERKHRVLVSMAGMLVELGIASVAAMVWANTSPGAVHAVAYNIMFIASVSTLFFNANPLLPYDGYYILADLVEIPNLRHRSKQYIYYLVRRYVWSVRRARSPAHTRGERIWFVIYGISSTIYRVFIVTAILLFVASKFPFVGIILALAAVAGWLFVPLGKFFKYLLTNNELARVRPRAIATVALTIILIIAGVGLIPFPDRARVEGIVEPAELAFVHPLADGFVNAFHPSDQQVDPQVDVLLEAENPELQAQLRTLILERDSLRVRKRLAGMESIAAAQALSKRIAAVDRRIEDASEDLSNLKLHPPIAGRWISPKIERLQGTYVQREHQIGLVASDEVVVLAVVKQDASARTHREIKAGDEVEIRVKGRADLELTGNVLELFPAGQKDLPSAALGYAVGGTVQTATDDPKGLRAQEPFFLVRIAPDPQSDVKLLTGQRVMVRLSMTDKPLAVQWWRGILQLVQRRFHT
jgi:putative peptide zinc metalloprotease protein